jgi:stress-induced morphogen
MTLDEVQRRIETKLPGSKVVIEDPYKDGVHIKAIVTYSGFEGKSLVEQHRMVYATLQKELEGELHALALDTRSE